MVSGKPSNQSARQVDIPTTTCIWFFWLLDSTCGNTCCKGNQEYGFCSHATDVRPAHIGYAYGPAVTCGDPVYDPERKANGCFGTIVGCSKRVS
jgi:hypothetical protein